MLGSFLEFSVETPDIAASLEFYLRLGFTELHVGETWKHPYAVVTDGRICIGLHQELGVAAQLTFVRPGLLRHLEALEALAVEFTVRRLGNDVFNELGWADPAGNHLRLIEARTFSPSGVAERQPARCGYFLEIGLPAPALTESTAFWEGLGFVGIAEPYAPVPHVGCTSDTINVGLYAEQDLPAPTLIFEADDIPALRAHYATLGLQIARGGPAGLGTGAAVLLVAPEGTRVLALASQG